MMRFLKYISKCHQSIEPSNVLCHSLYDLMCYLNSYLFKSLKNIQQGGNSKTGGDTISLGFSNILGGFSEFFLGFVKPPAAAAVAEFFLRFSRPQF